MVRETNARKKKIKYFGWASEKIRDYQDADPAAQAPIVRGIATELHANPVKYEEAGKAWISLFGTDPRFTAFSDAIAQQVDRLQQEDRKATV